MVWKISTNSAPIFENLRLVYLHRFIHIIDSTTPESASYQYSRQKYKPSMKFSFMIGRQSRESTWICLCALSGLDESIRVIYLFIYLNLCLCGITVFHQCVTEARTNEHEDELYNYNWQLHEFYNYITIWLRLSTARCVPLRCQFIQERNDHSQRGTVSYCFSGHVCAFKMSTYPSTYRAQCCLTSATGRDRRSQRGNAG
jgi:hypothetical protein